MPVSCGGDSRKMEQTWKDVDRFIHGFWKDEGVWISDSNREISTKFSKQTQDALYALEDTSWWFRYRSKVILMLAEKFFSKNSLFWMCEGWVYKFADAEEKIPHSAS